MAPEREAEYCASGTDGEGYACCYFPAIEGLAMLDRATHDDRYLKQARRMAEFFREFDACPSTIATETSRMAGHPALVRHHRPTRLPRPCQGEMGCRDAGRLHLAGGRGRRTLVRVHSASTKVAARRTGCGPRLDLWRFTGETRYLDAAERLLVNQYAANQCPNGGYGTRHFESTRPGPLPVAVWFAEAPFCCDFHGPLGLHFLKSYLAAGSPRGVLVNFPFDFTRGAGRRSGWLVKVRTQADVCPRPDNYRDRTGGASELSLRHDHLWLRMPPWAVAAKATVGQSALQAPTSSAATCASIAVSKAGEKVVVVLHNRLTFEGRRFQTVRPAAGGLSRLHD